MPTKRPIPKPPAGWTYGVILRSKGAAESAINRVMFIRMLASDEGPSNGVGYFEGMTATTDAYGVRIGKLHRLDHFPVAGWVIDV